MTNLDWSADYDHDPDTWEYGNYNNCLSQTSDGGYLLAASGSGGAFGTYMGSVQRWMQPETWNGPLT